MGPTLTLVANNERDIDRKFPEQLFIFGYFVNAGLEMPTIKEVDMAISYLCTERRVILYLSLSRYMAWIERWEIFTGITLKENPVN